MDETKHFYDQTTYLPKNHIKNVDGVDLSDSQVNLSKKYKKVWFAHSERRVPYLHIICEMLYEMPEKHCQAEGSPSEAHHHQL